MDVYNPDSHTSIVQYLLDTKKTFRGKRDDHFNKYEIVLGELIVDQINVRDDSNEVFKWYKKFKGSKEFKELVESSLIAAEDLNHDLFNAAKTIPNIDIKKVLRGNGKLIEYFLLYTDDLAKAALESYPDAIKYIEKPNQAQCLKAVKGRPDLVDYVIKFHNSLAFFKKLIKVNYTYLYAAPKKYRKELEKTAMSVNKEFANFKKNLRKRVKLDTLEFGFGKTFSERLRILVITEDAEYFESTVTSGRVDTSADLKSTFYGFRSMSHRVECTVFTKETYGKYWYLLKE
jgi:hypothetical protein